MHSFTESYLSDIDSIIPFENTTPVNQNKCSNNRMQSRLIRLIGVVFSNSAVFSVSGKYDSANECTQEISKLMKLHIQGVWKNAHEIYYITGSLRLVRMCGRAGCLCYVVYPHLMFHYAFINNIKQKAFCYLFVHCLSLHCSSVC